MLELISNPGHSSEEDDDEIFGLTTPYGSPTFAMDRLPSAREMASALGAFTNRTCTDLQSRLIAIEEEALMTATADYLETFREKLVPFWIQDEKLDLAEMCATDPADVAFEGAYYPE